MLEHISYLEWITQSHSHFEFIKDVQKLIESSTKEDAHMGDIEGMMNICPHQTSGGQWDEGRYKK